MDNATLVTQYSDGVVYRFTMDNGYAFEAYIPNGYTVDTNVIIYEHGDGGYSNDWTTYKAKFETGECDSIIIRADRNNSMALYNYLVNEYNLTDENRMTVSFSGGTSYALYETADMIKQNPDAEGPVAVILDGYIATDYMISNGTAETLKNGNAVVLAFGRGTGTSYYDQYLRFAKYSGVNMVIFKDTSEYGWSHTGVNKSFMEGGLLEYVEGTGELPDRYEIQVYDASTGTFRTLDRSAVATLADVYNLFGLEYDGSTKEYKYSVSELANLEDLELSSSDEALATLLNGIRGVIRSSNIVNKGYTGGSCSSTTMMPSQIPAVVSRYFEATTTALSKLVNETNQFAKIGESINEMEFNLEREAREINEIEITKAIYGSDGLVVTEEENNMQNSVNNNSTNNNWVNAVNSNGSSVTSKNSNTSSSGPVGTENSYVGSGSYTPTDYDNDTKEDVDIGKTEPLYEFLNYEDIVCDDNKIVYESTDGYKLIIHIDEDTITGVEHYYDLSLEENKDLTLNDIQELYKENMYSNEIFSEGDYVKVILGTDYYNDMTIEDIKKMYLEDDKFELCEEV